jgi:hypothetical protein
MMEGVVKNTLLSGRETTGKRSVTLGHDTIIGASIEIAVVPQNRSDLGFLRPVTLHSLFQPAQADSACWTQDNNPEVDEPSSQRILR